MNEKSFTRELRRGLGSAIIELKNNPEREKYREIVMRASLTDIAYDTQVEGTKGYYLYTAIKLFKDPEEFIENMIVKSKNELYWRISEQINDTLRCFANDGNEKARESIGEVIEEDDDDGIEYIRPKEEKITIEFLINHANWIKKKMETEPFRSPFNITGYARRFSKQASKKEIKKLAEIILSETDEFMKTALLRVFTLIDFPFDIDLLIPFAWSDYIDLREAVTDVLMRYKDKRVRALALEMFEKGYITDAFDLIKINFEPQDKPYIIKYVKRTKRVSTWIIRSIEHIYSEHKSAVSGDVLLYLYKNAKCSHCRFSVVKMMIDYNLIPHNILEECKFDSYEDTRELVSKGINKTL